MNAIRRAIIGEAGPASESASLFSATHREPWYNHTFFQDVVIQHVVRADGWVIDELSAPPQERKAVVVIQPPHTVRTGGLEHVHTL